jgi:transposase
MAHLSGADRSQLLLLPEAVDDYVGPDNPVRFIEAFVDGLDLGAAGFERVQPKGTGRPGYDPADLLKLYIYGYLNRIRSSRRLETETHRNVEAIWLLRHLKPDFKTIPDFRRDNRAAFKTVFREFAVLCRQLDLFGRELVAVDGTRIKAVNNKPRNFTRSSLVKAIQVADERLAGYMKRLDEGDADENRTPGGGSGNGDGKLAEKIAAIKSKRDRHKEMLAELDRTGADQVSLTDPDARAMARMTKVGVGYNIQLAVDVKHKLIAKQAVSNQVLDLGLLAQIATAAMEVLGVERIEAVADRGYGLCAKANPRSRRARGLLRQGRVPLRARPRRLRLPGSGNALAAVQGQVTRQCEGRLCQPRCLQGVLAKVALHSVIPPRLAPGERGRSRPHGGAVGPAHRCARPPTKQRRPFLRHHQAVDGPRHVPDAPARERSRQVQPDAHHRDLKLDGPSAHHRPRSIDGE